MGEYRGSRLRLVMRGRQRMVIMGEEQKLKRTGVEKPRARDMKRSKSARKVWEGLSGRKFFRAVAMRVPGGKGEQVWWVGRAESHPWKRKEDAGNIYRETYKQGPEETGAGWRG